MRYSIVIIINIFLFFQACSNKKKFNSIPVQNDTLSEVKLSDDELKMWWFKDIELDSIPGLSIDRAYDSILTNLGNGKQVIVALIDMPLDIKHEDLQQNIWVNPNEIPNNQIDDDNNGYVDDINGWNFISSRDGKTAKFVNYEYTRILKKYSDSFKNNTIQDSILYNTIVNANEKYKEKLKYAEKDTTFINVEERDKKIAAKTLSSVSKKTFNPLFINSLLLKTRLNL